MHGVDGYYTIINNPNSSGWGGHKDWLSTLYGFGGTQTEGGNPGKGTGTSSNYCSNYIADSYGGFGYGGSYGNCNSSSAGGGSGYYGGGSTARNGYSGGGGSSYISGHEGCDAIDESSTSSEIKHTGQSNHYSGKVFINTIMRAGNENQPTHDGNSTMIGNTGNGYAKITLVSID